MVKKSLGIINKNNSLLLVIDLQEKFKPVICNWGNLIKNISKLISSLQLLKVPILLTEQYPKGLGKTVNEIKQILKKHTLIEKTEFNCLDNKLFLKKLNQQKKKNIIICGIEAHVCVINTLLDALKQGFNVHLVTDAISSRKKSDLNIAIERTKQAGAFLTTTEMVIFQLMRSSKDPNFKKISKIIK